MLKRFLLLVTALTMVCSTLMAQVTTSGLNGKVTLDGADGETVIGANVLAVHEPTGMRYQAVTNSGGYFNIQGMRPGGPYKVTVSYVGFNSKVFNDIMLELGETYGLLVWLEGNASEMQEVTITKKATKFLAARTGASTNISNDMMMSLPTVSRSITDITRLSPYGGRGMSFAGSDGRLGNFTVDGANFNNEFGLNENLPGGGNPISIDAIEELQVVISPYDVRQTNFIGGGVNAITKSGSNQFKGSAYVYHRNENMRGSAVAGEQIDNARDRDRTTTYGFTLGGPIVKDKLFFFVNGEMNYSPTQANRWRASEDGVGDADNFISRTTVADMQRVSDFVRRQYGYDTGSFTDFPADENNYKVLARIDWNITGKHHLSARYNFTKNSHWETPVARSMDGGVRSPYARMSLYSMSFSNSMYAVDNLVHSFSVDLNSRLADDISNQFLVTFTKKDDVRSSDSSEFPFIDIQDGSGNNAQYLSLGYELFAWNNAVHNTSFNVKDDVNFYLGDHTLMAGLSYEYQMADNQYMRNGTGYYRYHSIDDFMNGATPEVVCLTYGYNGEKEPAARVRFHKIGAYAQDDWNITDKFKLTYGLRIDGLFFNNGDLMTNGVRYQDDNGQWVKSGILGQDYYDPDGSVRMIDTGKWPSGNIIFSPRVGFTWDILGDKSLKLCGGTGFFSGRLPLVFFCNMPSNGGLIQYQTQLGPSTKYDNLPDAVKAKYADMNAVMSQFAGGLVTDANGRATIDALQQKLAGMGFPQTVTPADGSVPGSIAAVSSHFKMPQVWKTSVAVDYQLPVSFPLTVTAEGLFEKTINATTISDWSLRPVEGFSRWNGADNRAIFPADFRTGTKAFVLENTHKGYAWMANVTLNAQPAKWVDLMAAYTHTVRREITGLHGSAAESAFSDVPSVDGPNNLSLHNSQYVIPDRFIASATLHDKGHNHYSIFYETWRGGYNYSYMLANNMNGDDYSYDALYIPTDNEVANGLFRFASASDQTRFMDYVHNDSYLNSHQGEYAEAYSVYSPWVHRVDIAYKHDFVVRTGKQKNTLQLGFDVKNVLNFFNSDWGVCKYMNPTLNEGRILKYEHTDAQGFPVFSTPEAVNANTETFIPFRGDIGQCWYASIGVRYMFN